MVIDRAAAMARPRRQAAIQGVKAATGSISQRKAAAPKNTSRNGPTRRVQARRSSQSAAASSDAGSSHHSEVSDDEDDEEEQRSSSPDDRDDASDVSDVSEPEVDMDDSGTFGGSAAGKRRAAPGQKQRKTANGRKSAGGQARRPKASKKTRAAKSAPTAASKKATARRMANKEDLPINQDNKLFNAVLDGAEDLKAVADDWVAYYADNKPAALAQFVNFVLRCSSCNESIDEVQVEETEDVVEILSEIQEHFKSQTMPSYPLVSRSAVYKSFRKNLSAFVEAVFVAANEADTLLDDTMIDILIAWIGSLTSSSYRALRHTATVFALLLIGQVARVSQDARDEFEKLIKTRDAEKRKSSAARVRALDGDVNNLADARKDLDQYHDSLLAAVFQHRFRDADPAIRLECVAEMGRWMKAYPAQFLASKYLVYPSWTLTDPDEQVRLTTVQGLAAVYSKHGLRGGLQSFTDRFVSRFLEMAKADIDMSIRVAAINLLVHVDKLGCVEEDARAGLSALVFDLEPRVRAAAARLASDSLESQLDTAADEDKGKRRFKLLAALFTRLESEEPDSAGVEDDNSSSQVEASSRVAIALEEIWSVNTSIRDWTPLLELLQLDHTGAEATSSAGGSRRHAARQQAAPSSISDDLRLEHAEEDVLVEALPVFLRKTRQAAEAAAAKGQQNGVAESIEAATKMNKDLINVIDKLFNKYRTETHRIRDVLLIPGQMDLNLYLEYQEIGAFRDLWDQVADQFERHSEASVLSNAVAAMKALNGTSAMSEVNATKLQAICEGSVTAFRAAATDAGAEELLASIRRVLCLALAFDVSKTLDESEKEEQHSSAWELVRNCASQREGLGKTGSEIALIAIQLMSVCLMWKTRALMQEEASDERDVEAGSLADKRHDMLVLLEGILEGRQDLPDLELQRSAFTELLDIHILYATLENAQKENTTANPDSLIGHGLPEKLKLVCEGALQDRLATQVMTEIARFSEDVSDDEASRSNSAGTQQQILAGLRREQRLVKAVGHYIGAIRLNVIELRLAIPLLAHYGQLGGLFDASLRVLVEAVREAGIFQGRANQACRIIIESLKQSFETVKDNEGQDSNFVALSRQLSNCLVVRGAQLAITDSVSSTALTAMHERALSWALDRVKTASENDDEDGLAHSAAFFKALSNLLVGLTARDALSIKLALANALKDRSIAIPAAEKAWDPLRGYEKRLVTLASKSEAFAARSEPSRSSAAPAQSKEPVEDVSIADMPATSPVQASPAATRPRPRARASAARRSSGADLGFDDTVGDDSLADSTLGFGDTGMDSTMSLRGLDVTDDSVTGVFDRSGRRARESRNTTRQRSEESDDDDSTGTLAPAKRRRTRRS